MIKVTVWEEYVQSRDDAEVKAIYPNGIHEYIAGFLQNSEGLFVRTANLHQKDDGLPQELLEETDVLIWWGHCAHDKVSDETVKRVHERVLNGMGIVFLHSAHLAKPFKTLMGTSCSLKWREGDKEILWVTAPQHPIVSGIGEYIALEKEEMYGEFFDIPAPDELIMTGWFSGGEVFRSLCTWNRGYGKVVYFQPGHETFPIYHNKAIQRVITNAVRWAYCPKHRGGISCPNPEPAVGKIFS